MKPSIIPPSPRPFSTYSIPKLPLSPHFHSGNMVKLDQLKNHFCDNGAVPVADANLLVFVAWTEVLCETHPRWR